ncbi:hypothetical protein [Celeribacter sp.]|uniref:hypothetical protein n=1 Tax=Celeribacter sp. TaxID=1890673 RepID=UPI003A8E6CF9
MGIFFRRTAERRPNTENISTSYINRAPYQQRTSSTQSNLFKHLSQMGPETLHFLESVLLNNDPVVSPEHARMVMESYLAADISAETGDPVDLPLSNHSLSLLADMIAAKNSDAA